MKKIYLETRRKGNIQHTVKQRKANLIGHILLGNSVLKRVIEGKLERRIEVTGRWEWKCKPVLDDLKKMRGYWKLKEEALANTWRTCFGRCCAPVVRQVMQRWCLWPCDVYPIVHVKQGWLVFTVWCLPAVMYTCVIQLFAFLFYKLGVSHSGIFPIT